MKRLWPLLLIAAGLLLIFGGFLYIVMTEGVPYQDPTPAMSARSAYHEHISDLISASGLVVFAVGVVAGIIRLIVRRIRPPTTP